MISNNKIFKSCFLFFFLRWILGGIVCYNEANNSQGHPPKTKVYGFSLRNSRYETLLGTRLCQAISINIKYKIKNKKNKQKTSVKIET